MSASHCSGIGETSYVIFDLETTGLSSDTCEIIQIAATRFRSDGAVAGDSFFSFCKPARPIDVLEKFSSFVGNSVIMAHNGHRFDTKFLEATCARHGVRKRPVQSIDTIAFSRQLFGTTRGTGHSLDRVMQRLGLNASKYQRHDARGDIMALADSVKIMWQRLGLDLNCSGIPRRETALPHI